jgi:hypothetical protein
VTWNTVRIDVLSVASRGVREAMLSIPKSGDDVRSVRL